MLNKINDVDLCKEGSIYNNALNVQMHIFNQHYDITIELINKYLFHWLFIVLGIIYLVHVNTVYIIAKVDTDHKYFRYHVLTSRKRKWDGKVHVQQFILNSQIQFYLLFQVEITWALQVQTEHLFMHLKEIITASVIFIAKWDKLKRLT